MKTQDRTIKIAEYTFDEKEHLHKLGDKALTGVTTILGVINKPALVQWSASEAINYVEKFLDEEGAFLPDVEWKTVLKEARVAHRKKKEAAGDAGTDIHFMVESYIKSLIEENDGYADSTILEIFEKDPIKAPQVKNFLEWAVKNNVKFLASEKHVYSKRMWIGGIADIICEIDGKRYVGDIKTSSGIYPEAYIQCSAYAECLREMSETTPEQKLMNTVKQFFDGVVVINLKKDGKFDVGFNYDIEGNLRCFEAALCIYRHMESLKK